MALAEGGDDSSETDTDDSDDSSEYFRTGGGGGGPHTQHAGWRAYFHTAGVLTAESKSKYAGSTLFGFVQPPRKSPRHPGGGSLLPCLPERRGS